MTDDREAIDDLVPPFSASTAHSLLHDRLLNDLGVETRICCVCARDVSGVIPPESDANQSRTMIQMVRQGDQLDHITQALCAALRRLVDIEMGRVSMVFSE